MLTAPYQPVDVSDVDLAFPAHALDVMPPHDVCRGHREYWSRDLFSDWMFFGLADVQFAPSNPSWTQEDVDQAIRHLNVIIGSFQPKHEHKEDAVAFLLEEWFQAVRWKPKHNLGEWKSTPDIEWPS